MNTRTAFFKQYLHWLPTLFIVFVFVQSLFFKFTNSPETVYIFETKLDAWAASLGFGGVFAPGGIFSAKVVGSFELLASVLLLAGAGWKKPLQVFGAALALAVISGAIFFHLFTPLGVAVQNTDGSSDGGQLFLLACGVWLASAFLLFHLRMIWRPWLGRLRLAA
jgi:hypothetical protein